MYQRSVAHTYTEHVPISDKRHKESGLDINGFISVSVQIRLRRGEKKRDRRYRDCALGDGLRSKGRPKCSRLARQKGEEEVTHSAKRKRKGDKDISQRKDSTENGWFGRRHRGSIHNKFTTCLPPFHHRTSSWAPFLIVLRTAAELPKIQREINFRVTALSAIFA
ncbi:hypothetical protein RRG08_021777 [Elysia crispata]|uniref:Uncharacterized protein n=1 Tax=Elysia crispata TaxID=231223 RepID=A0AAE0ZZ61_9GAST|nr:hypothetical protein RRG08_021777 [Elysia crispata]